MTDWSRSDIPDLSGQTAIITGANNGIGYETALALADAGARVVMACRNGARAEAAADSIRAASPGARLEVADLDLSSLESVRSFATGFAASNDRLDLLINNAGIMAVPWSLSPDGFELQLATNHLGHFLLTGLLLGPLESADSARVVTVASMAHKRAGATIDFDDMEYRQNYSAMWAYRRSKLANLLFSYELDRRLRRSGSGVVSVAAHPGITQTSLATEDFRPWWFKSARAAVGLVLQGAATGALPTLRAAVDPTAVGGQYYGPKGWGEIFGAPVLVGSSDTSRDEALARSLWEWSERSTEVEYP